MTSFQSDDITLEIREPDLIVLPIPPKQPLANTSIQIDVGLSNNTSTPVYLNPNYTLIPQLITSDDQVLHKRVIKSEPQPNRLPQPSVSVKLFRLVYRLTHPHWKRETQKFETYEPGHGSNVSLTLKVCWQDDQLQLQILNRFNQFWDSDFKLGNSWSFGEIQAGVYKFRFIWENSSSSETNSNLDIKQGIPVGELATQFVNLRLIETIETDNTALEVDGIRFETVMPESSLIVPTVSEPQKFQYSLKRFLKRPYRTGERLLFTPVQIGIRITNNTTEPLQFSFYETLIPELVTEDGQLIQRGYASNLLIFPKESDFLLCRPFESVTFFPRVILYWHKDDQFSLSFFTGDGGNCSCGGLLLGTYQIRFSYKKLGLSFTSTPNGGEPIERRFSERVWSGRADTPFIKFQLVES